MLKSTRHQLINLVQHNRSLFVPKAQKAITNALNETLKPVYIAVAKGLHRASDIDKHLIQPTFIKAAIKGIYLDAGMYFGKAQYDALAKQVKADKASIIRKDDGDFEDEMNDRVNKFIETVGGAMITNINDTTLDQVRNFIKDEMEQGTGAAQLAADLRKNFDMFNSTRAMTIAVTEVGRASNFAGNEGRDMIADDYDVKVGKGWLHAGSSAHDREAHLDLDGTVISNDDDFDVDGESASYPQDPRLSAEESVNCKCACFGTLLK